MSNDLNGVIMLEYIRDNLTDEYGILPLQDSILRIAVYIDQLCQANQINYCLMGGSALGAVRHGGFIPWDDDLDIFMKPEDFDKFRRVFEETGDHETFYLQQLFYRVGMVASAKLRLNGTTYLEEAIKDWKIHHGIFVDIFILHPCPKGRVKQFCQCMAAKYILAMGQSYKNHRYTGIRRFVTAVLRLLPREFGVYRALKLVYRYDHKPTPYLCHFMGKAFFKRGIYPSTLFRAYQRHPFEKSALMLSADTPAYLKELFGNYMVLPPKSSIKHAQHAWLWDTERDYSYYVGENDKSQEKDLV